MSAQSKNVCFLVFGWLMQIRFSSEKKYLDSRSQKLPTTTKTEILSTATNQRQEEQSADKTEFEEPITCLDISQPKGGPSTFSG